jgi:cysteine desulfurase
VFTSGGSESNNHALKGVFFAKGKAKAHFITTQVEHPAIINPCRFLERLGATATYLPVDEFGPGARIVPWSQPQTSLS